MSDFLDLVEQSYEKVIKKTCRMSTRGKAPGCKAREEAKASNFSTLCENDFEAILKKKKTKRIALYEHEGLFSRVLRKMLAWREIKSLLVVIVPSGLIENLYNNNGIWESL